jgi:hypothetical protein
MVKDFKKFEYDLDSDAFYDMPYSSWEIYMAIDKAINVDKVVNFLIKNNHWAYLYTQQHQSLRHYILHGYIMLQTPKNYDWWEENLSEFDEDGEYRMTSEHPNAYRNRHIDYISHLNLYYASLIKIDKGPYIPGTGPCMYNY